MARRFGVLLVTCGLVAGCGGDDSGCDVFSDASCLEVARIVADIETLASPELAGRRAGFPGNDLAVDFVDARFESLGMPPPGGAPSRRQPFPVEVWEPQSPPTLALGALQLTAGIGEGLDVVENALSGTVTDAPVVFAGYGLLEFERASWASDACPLGEGIYDDWAALGDLTGHVVVKLDGIPSWTLRCASGFRTICGMLKDRGAAALVVASPAGASRSFHATGCSLPAVQITHEVLEATLPEISAWEASIEQGESASRKLPGLRASVQVQAATAERFAENVLAVIPGANRELRDEVVVIGAHLDHLGRAPFRDAYFPGANDNASGLAVILELARAIAASPTKPKRTLVFAAWNAEESWMVGSYAYVAAPLLPLERTVAAFAVDMVGGSPVVTLATSTPEIAATLEAGRRVLGLDLDWPSFTYPWDGPNDHLPFVERGIPGAMFTTTESNAAIGAYHTVDDTPDTLSREALEVSAQLVWATVRQYALGQEEPRAAADPSGAAATPAALSACFASGPAVAPRR
jgi:hypothetical protein